MSARCSNFAIVGLPESGAAHSARRRAWTHAFAEQRACRSERAFRNILNRKLAPILARPEVKQRFLDSGSEVKWQGPNEFGDFVKAEVVKGTALTREANIQPE
jgi:tripartite-type tricarboxylate transporter receptor subunit TctC